MKSQTSLVARQTRLNDWAEQIRECNNRPQGMTIGEWCQSHGITKANYYWRLRKVREALLKAADTAPSFVELKEPVPEATLIISEHSSEFKIMAIIKTDQCAIEITGQASCDFLTNLLGVLNHA